MKKTLVWILSFLTACVLLAGAVQILGVAAARPPAGVAAAAPAAAPDCALLDDARARGLMSVGLELRLRFQCGRLDRSGETVDAVDAPAAPQAVARADVQVNDSSGDILDALLCSLQAAWSWSRRNNGYGIPANVNKLEGWITDPELLDS